jgi:hypothetical protein
MSKLQCFCSQIWVYSGSTLLHAARISIKGTLGRSLKLNQWITVLSYEHIIKSLFGHGISETTRTFWNEILFSRLFHETVI